MHVKIASSKFQFEQILQIYLTYCQMTFSWWVRDMYCFTTGATTDALDWRIRQKTRAIQPDTKKL